MKPTVLHIKNMVCPRCQKVVRKELENQGLHPLSVHLGTVTLQESTEEMDQQAIRTALAAHGFELLDEKKAVLVEKIKNIIVELIHHRSATSGNVSDLIAERLGLDYAYLSHLISSTEGITIEKYTILQRIERVKELLIYDELSLSQIADQLGYSSVAHLSNQFKKITGLTPSSYKKLRENIRRPLDEL